VVAARQVLAGLPLGIVTITVWCYALVWLPKSLSDGAVIGTAFALTVLTLAAWIRFYARRWAPRPGWIWTAERAPRALGEGSPA
jgi:hypothetical protein